MKGNQQTLSIGRNVTFVGRRQEMGDAGKQKKFIIKDGRLEKIIRKRERGGLSKVPYKKKRNQR